MKNNYWIKLWFEILSDPKMGRLPDRLWRRIIELFILAGIQADEGNLPSLSDMAWQLKLSDRALEADLIKIENTGIVKRKEDNGWFITNFDKRNAAVSDSQRSKDFRDRQRDELDDAKRNDTATSRDELSNATVTGRPVEEEGDVEVEVKELISLTPPNPHDEFAPFADAFKECAGIEVKRNAYNEATIRKYIGMGVTVSELKDAIGGLQDKDYSVKSIRSVEKWLTSLKEQQKKPKPTRTRKPADTGASLDKFKQLYKSQGA